MLAIARTPSSNSVYITLVMSGLFHHSKNCISNACFETRLLLCGKKRTSLQLRLYSLKYIFRLLLCVSRGLWTLFLGFSLFSLFSCVAQTS